LVIRRGEIWWATLPDPRASEPGYSRPVLVVQSDAFNRSRIQTILAVVVTSTTRLAGAPGNVLLSRRESGLPKTSVANVSQVITIDKRFLTRKVRSVPKRVVNQVDAGLRLALSL
jgi:mRNA interferase MazF